MKRIEYLLAAFLLLSGLSGKTQDVLSKTEAVETILRNNYDVRIAANNVAIAANTADPGFVGFNPRVDATGGIGADVANAYQQFADGREISGKGTLPVRGNANLGIQYVLYEGNARNLRLSQLQEQAKLASLAQRQTIEVSILELMVAYYEVARLTEAVRALEETLLVSDRRLTRAQYGFDYGQGNRLQVLNAEVDINRDSVNLINAMQQLANSKRDVNVLLAREANTPFDIDTTIIYADDLVMRELLDSAFINNTQLALANKDFDIIEYDYELNESGKRPVVIFDGSAFGSISSDLSDQSFINYQTQYGLSGGLSVAWNISDGGVRRVQRENIRLSLENQRIAVDQIENELERGLRNAWEVYENALYVLKVERHNLSTNRENFNRTQEQYNIGQVTSVEFRQAQFNQLNAEISYVTAKYTAKVAELRLLQLCGKILDAVY